MHRGLMCGLICLAVAGGCSRTRYRTAADCDAYATLHQKTSLSPWHQPGFTIDVDPRSRMFDPTPRDAPRLPAPEPTIYGYELPELSSTLEKPARPTESGVEAVTAGEPDQAAAQEPLPAPDAPADSAAEAFPESESQGAAAGDEGQSAGAQTPPPIDRSNWEAIPPQALARMLEFDRVRSEYERTYKAPPDPSQRAAGPQFALEEFVELALLNSREYQTQKETLYRAALALTLERYDYRLKFSRGGPGGTDVNYSHARQGTTVNGLGVPSSAQLDRVLGTGGTLLARFANSVVLTFNGPTGFSADVSSEMFFNFSQAILQRDVIFERLTQAERNVIYATRTYVRFRKTMFVQLATDYFALVRNYRQIEIESQNYFSLVQALNQARAELVAGLRSRIQVEQIEQSMLLGRSRLISTAVALERNLDRYKLTLGLPPEQLLNVDLAELNDLTLRDTAAVSAQVVLRTRERLAVERERPHPQRTELVNTAVVLGARLQDWLELESGLREGAAAPRELDELGARLQVDEARINADDDRQALQKDLQSENPPPLRLFQRTTDLVDSLDGVIRRQAELASALMLPAERTAEIENEARTLRERGAALRKRLAAALEQAQLEQVPVLYEESGQLLADVEALLLRSSALAGDDSAALTPEQALARTLEQIDVLLARSEQLLSAARIDLTPIDIPVDDAMLTAIASRLDLMNQRGSLADSRRAVKLAADDLRSILNLNASETIGTPTNKPFDYTFDNSRTQLGLSFDLPLNRRAQRNSYRSQLVNYHAGLRTLMQAEDTVKLAVRNDLRDLGLASTQYQITVASAALASERVESTRLELSLGFPGVAARDFLEAQDAFRVALGGVADNHIGYMVNRMTFFLDLEALQIDDRGFWQQLRDEENQPEPLYGLPPEAGDPYGDLPPWVRYSPEVRGLHRGR